MYKWLLSICFFILSSIANAETLTPDMIKQVHDQVKASFFDGCSKNLKGPVIEVCRCLAEKTEMSLNDQALATCTNDENGKDCVTKAVKEASTKATTQDNITECKKKIEGATTVPTAPAAVPAATTPPTTMNAAPSTNNTSSATMNAAPSKQTPGS